MSKVLLISILIMTVAVPLQSAGHRSAIRGLRRVITTMSAFVAVYVFLIVYVLPRLP